MSDADQSIPSRIAIADISPAPSPEVLVAITAALEEGWPRPAAAPTVCGPTERETRWRFSQRRWQHRSVPMQTWGR